MIECGMCHGPAVRYLGQLGKLFHYVCCHCGAYINSYIPPEEDDDDE